MDVLWELVRPFGMIFGLRGANDSLITDPNVSMSPSRARRKSEVSREDTKIFENVSPKVAIALMKNSEVILQYLELKDLLVFSTCSRFCANMFISQQCILDNLKRNEEKLASISKFKISFASELSLGLFRRLLNCIVNGKKAIISIDDETGRLQMDTLGSVKEENTPYAARVDEVERIRFSDVVLPGIESILSAHSVDEYDDFNPKHPTFHVNMGPPAVSAAVTSKSTRETRTRKMQAYRI